MTTQPIEIIWSETGLIEEHEKFKVEGHALAGELRLLDQNTDDELERLARRFRAGNYSAEEYEAIVTRTKSQHEIDERKTVVRASSISRGRVWRDGPYIILRTNRGSRIIGELDNPSLAPAWIPEIEKPAPDAAPTVVTIEEADRQLERKLDAIMRALGLDTDDDKPRVDAPPEHA